MTNMSYTNLYRLIIFMTKKYAAYVWRKASSRMRRSNSVKFLSGHALQICNPGSLCFLESSILDQSSLCITKMFLEESKVELRKICEFTCHKSLTVNHMDHLPLIQLLSNREYIITAPTSTSPLIIRKLLFLVSGK